jgi:succinate dehydrogenase / fumarate reductase cytochrome b subunit
MSVASPPRPAGAATRAVTGTALAARRRRPLLLDLYATAVGKKYAMALSGIAMMTFVFAHMLGNLKMYLGAAELDHYAEFLRMLAYPIVPRDGVLWITRAALLGATALHVHAAWSLTVLNRRARPVRYQGARDYEEASLASRSMRWTGVVVLAFIVWHLADLTFGVTNTVGASGEFVKEDVYDNVVRSLGRWPVALFYVAANLLLGLHLRHGAWSIFQSLGWSSPRFNAWRRAFANSFAAIVVVGNVSFPVAVTLGIVG